MRIRHTVATSIILLAIITACRDESLPKPKTGTDGISNPSAKINTSGWADSPFISRDGNRLYFMYSRWVFGEFIADPNRDPALLRIAGPDRPGLHKSTQAFEESDIYVSYRSNNGTWSAPENLGLNGPFGDASGMEFNNGNSFIWLQDGEITIAHRSANGSWQATMLPSPSINMHGNLPDGSYIFQDNPHISPNGNTLWFTSTRPGGFGGKDIWISLRNGAGVWGAPTNMGATINSAADEDQFWLNPNGTEYYLNRESQIYRGTVNGNVYSAPTLVNLGALTIVAEASITDDGTRIYFVSMDPITKNIQLLTAIRQTDGSWGTPLPVD